jgi:hypothetical protein
MSDVVGDKDIIEYTVLLAACNGKNKKFVTAE